MSTDPDGAQDWTTLVTRQDADGAATLTLNRPEKRNALNVDVFRALDAHLAGHVTGTTLAVDGGARAAPNYDLGPSRAASARNRRALGIDLAPQDRNDG